MAYFVLVATLLSTGGTIVAKETLRWQPWSEATFQKAAAEKRPVFLSIQYATCHFCHLMERESFHDPEIIGYLNKHYVAIKVDQAKRPDIAQTYLTTLWILGQTPAWPITLWLLPNKIPFFAGTYFPPQDIDGELGLRTLLRNLYEAYIREKDTVQERAKQIEEKLTLYAAAKQRKTITNERPFRKAYELYRTNYDKTHGGFVSTQKFPQPGVLAFLMRYGHHNNEKHATEMALDTMKKMAQGGIYDQLGGGFHRYATDVAWRTPHFEKHLSYNALLALRYLEAYQISKEPLYERIARETLNWIKRDLSTMKGAFLSGMDSESGSEEGQFYLWSWREIIEQLGVSKGSLIARYFGVTKEGNFQGQNILYVAEAPHPPAEALLDESRKKLLEIRQTRRQPNRTNIVGTGENGLAIAALARASFVLQDDSLAKVAQRAATVVLERLKRNGRLLRSCEKDHCEGKATLNDYAFFVFGLLNLFEATQDIFWLKEAKALSDAEVLYFWDKRDGGFFFTSHDCEKVLIQSKLFLEEEEPSGNALSARNLLRLKDLTEEPEYAKTATDILPAFGKILERQPYVAPTMVEALADQLNPAKQIVIVIPKGEANAEPLLGVLRKTYLPNLAFVFAQEGKDQQAMGKIVPLVREKVSIGGKPTAYVCDKTTCFLPTSDPKILAQQLVHTSETK